LQLKQSPTEAVVLELDCLAALLEEKSLLTIERQLGLIGELIVLERMISAEGPDAIEAWIGPLQEPHDFRVGNHEFEVKSTAGTRRIHTIHNPTQLTVSPGCLLFIISILLGPGGKSGGFSLATKIESIQMLLKHSVHQKKQFRDRLELCGYSSRDHSQYNRAFGLRRPLAIVPIEARFPSITSDGLQTLLGQESNRIARFVYDVNVEGLEGEEGTQLYSQVFPWTEVV
jgi:hypothetical protein